MEILRNPWVRVLLISTTVGMVSWALQETASVTVPIVSAVGDVALPLAIGFTIAYVLTPLVDLLQSLRLNRTVAALVLLATVTVGLVVATSLIVPAVVHQTMALATRVFRSGMDQPPAIGAGTPGTSGAASVPTATPPDRAALPGSPGSPGSPGAGPAVSLPSSQPGLLSQGLGWLEREQDRIRRWMRLGYDDHTLAFLMVYHEETAADREALDQLMDLGRRRVPLAMWPESLRQPPPAHAADVWHGSWPGLSAEGIEAAATVIGASERDAWIRQLAWRGQILAGIHLQLVADLRDMRDGLPPRDQIGVRLAELWKRPLTAQERAIGHQEAALLAEDARHGVSAANALITDLGSGGDAGGALIGSALNTVEAQLHSLLQGLPERVSSGLRQILLSMDRVLVLGMSLVLIPVYVFFLTLAMPSIRATIRRYIPAHGRQRTLRILHDIESVVAAFFRGRLIICVICALLTWIGFAILGMRYAGLFGLLIGLATAVPFAGLLALIPAVGLHLVDGGSLLVAGLAVGVYACVATIEAIILTPLVLGREVELHPVVLIISLLLCGRLLGIIGVIAAVPIAATVRILARQFLLPRLRRQADLPMETARFNRPSGDQGPRVPAARTGDPPEDMEAV